MWEDPQGICHGRFRLPRRYGHALKKALEALMSPARRATGTTSTDTGTGTGTTPSGDPHAATDTDHTNDTADADDADDADDTGCAAPPPHRDLRPLPVRRGEAFCELLDRISADNLPTTGGYDATLIVTMTHEHLLASLETAGVATLDTGARISAAEARKMACEHKILPMVLDSTGAVLDQGRTKRLHTKAQRMALLAQQQHCTAEHCDVPASMCHVHHDLAWSTGGPTDTTTGRLLCGPHHRRLHDPAIGHRITADNHVQFYRRT